MRRTSASILAAIILVSRAAPAQTATPTKGEQPSQAETERVWYGWQTLATDGAALGLFYAAASERSGALAWSGVAVYALGGPAVHLAHEHLGKAAGSLGLRVGLPVAGGLALGLALHKDCTGSSSEGECGIDETLGALAGAALGAIAAAVIDSAAIAREDAPKPRNAAGVTLSPHVSVQSGSYNAGIVGSF